MRRRLDTSLSSSWSKASRSASPASSSRWIRSRNSSGLTSPFTCGGSSRYQVVNRLTVVAVAEQEREDVAVGRVQSHAVEVEDKRHHHRQDRGRNRRLMQRRQRCGQNRPAQHRARRRRRQIDLPFAEAQLARVDVDTDGACADQELTINDRPVQHEQARELVKDGAVEAPALAKAVDATNSAGSIRRRVVTRAPSRRGDARTSAGGESWRRSPLDVLVEPEAGQKPVGVAVEEARVSSYRAGNPLHHLGPSAGVSLMHTQSALPPPPRTTP